MCLHNWLVAFFGANEDAFQEQTSICTNIKFYYTGCNWFKTENCTIFLICAGDKSMSEVAMLETQYLASRLMVL